MDIRETSVPVRALALALVGDEHRADDLLQEAHVRTLERPPRRSGSTVGWMATVVRNLVRDGWRTDRRRAERERAVARPDLVPDATGTAARADAHQRLVREVLRLREPFRTAILMRFFDDLPPRRIARRLGVPPATVRTRIHRGLAALRRSLGERDPNGRRLALLPLAAKGGILVTAKKTAIVGVVLLLLLTGFALFSAGDHDAPPVTEKAESLEEPRAPMESMEAPKVLLEAPEKPAGPPEAERLVPRIVREIPPAPEEEGPGEEVAEAKAVAAGGGGLALVPGRDRWARVPPRGDVTIEGRVTDAVGTPLTGARVYRIMLAADGEPQRRFGRLFFERIGETGPGDAFRIGGQPSAPFLAQADYHVSRRDPEGYLLLDGARRIDARDGETVEVVVRDVAGAPVRGDLVFVGEKSAELDADGRWTFRALPPGNYRVRTGAAGYAQKEAEVQLKPGGSERVELVLDYASKGGLEISGVVVDREDRPCAGAVLYLGTGFEDSREARTDGGGRFRFSGLPAAASGKDAAVWVYPPGDREAFLFEKVEGVAIPTRDLRVVVRRLAPLRLLVRDRRTGDPVPLFNVGAKAVFVEGGRETARDLLGGRVWSPGGEMTIHVPAARIRLEIEAVQTRNPAAPGSGGTRSGPHRVPHPARPEAVQTKDREGEVGEAEREPSDVVVEKVPVPFHSIEVDPE